VSATDIPLFPLSAVLMPYGRLPLQIFEQRYLDLVRSCLRSDTGFGVVWIRRGAEVAARGSADPELGDYGTYARIVDWDQLPNGLLGITVEGSERFELRAVSSIASQLRMAEVDMLPRPAAEPMQPQWQTVADVLAGLEVHPHVQRMGLDIDYDNGWQVALTLAQLLPLEEALKYELLGCRELPELMHQLDGILNQISD
jgi:Lon protease-like protein